MRVALAIICVLIPASAAAEEPAPVPPAGQQPAEPPAEQPVPEPKVDPAYGDQRDPADGGGGYFASPRGKDIVITMTPDRSTRNLATLTILGAAGVVVGAMGLYFHMDSRSATQEVGASRPTGVSWTPEREDTYDRAHRSATAAGVLYGIGGGLLLATAITYIVTEPKLETTVIRPHAAAKPTALVAPTRGGALIGGAWSF